VAGVDPVPWILNDTLALNTIALIVVMAWMWTGFAMVIISAALKGISAELLEAARVDGATEWQVFRRIVFPLLLPTIAVVSTTIIITALKAFDIVYVMTGGQNDTNVIAHLMYQEMFSFSDFGRASALAVILLIAIVPIMLFNISRFRAQEAIR
jgi:alpha-glucoside transport system permease protein